MLKNQNRNNLDKLFKQFKNLNESQVQQLQLLPALYKEWNEKINVISRKDIENVGLHHVFHSLLLTKFATFKPGTQITDVGTGGGFPGIPLAIALPHVQFILIDGTRKKLTVAQDIADQLNLKNVKTIHTRAEEFKQKSDFVVTRAVASMPKLIHWVRPLIKSAQKNAIPNGMFAWKGGNIKEELSEMPKGEYTEIHPLLKVTSDPYFEEKCIVYWQW